MDPPERFVSAGELRARFNAGNYWGRAQAGEFRIVLRRDSHPTSVQRGEPFCTRSQILAYFDTAGQRLAIVHQYLRPDGTIGGSGRPDPKLLFEGGIEYRVEPPEQNYRSPLP